MPPIGKLGIIIACGDTLTRFGLSFLLGLRKDWEIVRIATNGITTVNLAQELRPDLIVIDKDIPGIDGLEASSQILKQAPKTRILMLCRWVDASTLSSGLELGIEGFVVTSDPESYVTDAIEALQRGHSFFSPSMLSLQKSCPFPDSGSSGSALRNVCKRLTGRELDIVRLVGQGSSNKDVASLLNISVRTAENHRARAMRKLQLQKRSDLIRFAIRSGMVGV